MRTITAILAACIHLCALAKESRHIVTPAWLASHPETIILEAAWTPSGKPAADYLAGHIPGAIHVNTDDFETPSPHWRLRPLGELRRVIGRLGIGATSTVVVYSKQTIAAARVWWILYYAGVSDVRYLDGGHSAWIRAGYPSDLVPRKAIPRRFAGKPRTEALANRKDVAARRANVILADVRSREEYDGVVSGYSYLKAKGRIPGAVFAEDADDRATIYQTSDGYLRPLETIRQLWAERGVLKPGSEIIFTCGSGWRSSLAFLYALEMGLPRIQNYSDGWSGWSR